MERELSTLRRVSGWTSSANLAGRFRRCGVFSARGLVLGFLAGAFLQASGPYEKPADPSPFPPLPPSEASGGLRLAQGFAATVFADLEGTPRHIAVRANGDVYVALRQNGTVALRDENGDGKADLQKVFGGFGGTGIAITTLKGKEYLYRSSDDAVYRWQLQPHELVPTGIRETVVKGLPLQRQHAAKAIALDDDGHLYVVIGAPSNNCQEQDRSEGSPGQSPCPLLKDHAGIWRFAADKPNQQHEDGARYVAGLRNAVAIAWNGAAGALYLVQHGRDQLNSFYPQYYSAEDNADLPAEEFHRAEKGANIGWPYSYWDQRLGARMLAPEYGGDGKKRADKIGAQNPLVAFPGHWAPNGLLFYTGAQFPNYFRDGAFIAFHGSWNRAPLPQAGFNVVYVPLDANGSPRAAWHVFGDGFAGQIGAGRPSQAEQRPMGLAQAPDGALFISSSHGRIWRVTYNGTR
jgi:glucose/arabinose dehydrogenase